MRKIVLCTNPARDAALSVTGRLAEIVRDCGDMPAVCILENLGQTEVPENLEVFRAEDAFAGAELVISVGGDGTLLHAARLAAAEGTPVLGVNLGTKGFLTEIERDALEDVRDVLTGSYTLDCRMMLDVQLERSSKIIYSDFALNDAMVGGMARVIRLTVYGDARKMSAFAGDGVVVSTPTGSTAYSMSAGGPIVEPATENIIVTPVCAHALIAKSYVLAPERRVTIEVGKLEGKSAYMSVDGGASVSLVGGDLIHICRSKYETRLIRLYDKSFYEKVNEKLGEI